MLLRQHYGGSLDVKAGSLNNMFDFKKGPNDKKLFLDEKTGQPVKGKGGYSKIQD